jgi:hypothetical protein
MLFLLLAACCLPDARAQREPVHYFHSSRMPPGVVGQAQLHRGGPLQGYFQPVEIQGPQGTHVSVAVAGRFEPSEPAPALVGMLIGQVYRLRITRIPRNEGMEVYPTIEVINRLYPPPGLENHFPIPVQLTLEELEIALSGRLVTRVIYLEDPNQALPVRDDPHRQRYFELPATENPLQVADRLGRPVAILHMGSRTPEIDALSQRFLFACPPLLKLKKPDRLPDPRSGLEEQLPPIPRIMSGTGGFHLPAAGRSDPGRIYVERVHR